MQESEGPRHLNPFVRTRAQRGWVILGVSLILTFTLAGSGVDAPLLSVVLAVALTVGLLLGMWPLFAGVPATAGAAGRRPSFFGRVPPSWEYYETFGK